MSAFDVALGQRIAALRTEDDMSRELLAKNLGVHQTAIGKIERGERRVTAEELTLIAAEFGVSLDMLCGLDSLAVDHSAQRQAREALARIHEITSRFAKAATA